MSLGFLTFYKIKILITLTKNHFKWNEFFKDWKIFFVKFIKMNFCDDKTIEIQKSSANLIPKKNSWPHRE